VVFATEEGGNRQKALVKDTRTRKYINAVFFDPNFVSRSVASCPDANGNGSEEIVLLGQRDNGRVRAIVKDALTDEVLGKVDF